MYKILKHGDIPVLRAETGLSGQIVRIADIINREHIPVGVSSLFPEILLQQLIKWGEKRAIPHMRQNLAKLTEILGGVPSEELLHTCQVSLTDCYYYVPEKDCDKITWESVNYYDNGFDDGFSKKYLYDTGIGYHSGSNVPDLTTNGNLEKVWISADNVPLLLKWGDMGPLSAECPGKNLLSANEVAAFMISRIMNVSATEYLCVDVNGMKLCACPSFIADPYTEYVTADQIRAEEKVSSLALYDRLCDLGLKRDVDNMILFDHIIHNTDRHMSNFGILRDGRTLAIKGFAPLYDNGSSLYWNKDKKYTKPFTDLRSEQLSLISDLSDRILPDIMDIKRIIKETYDRFDINGDIYDQVISDLEDSYEMASMVKEHDDRNMDKL